MNTRKTMLAFGAALAALPPAALAQHEMPEMTAPLATIAPTRVYTVTGQENWDNLTGFGKNASAVAMMNLMMVGGSGYENMQMEPMTMDFSGGSLGEAAAPSAAASSRSGSGLGASVSPNPPIVGDNTIEFTWTDSQGRPISGVDISASVGMTNMDMGTTHPDVRDLGGGRYAVTPQFTMIGPWRVSLSGGGREAALDFDAGSRMKWTPDGAAPAPRPADVPNSDSPAPQPDKAATADAGAHAAHHPESTAPAPEPHPTMTGAPVQAPVVLKVDATIAKPAAGDNPMTITVIGADGKPVTDAKISASVAMTNMDMGTTRPTVKEIGGGRYRTAPQFTMLGPWRVTLTITPPDGKPMTRAFDFTVKQ